MDHQRLERMAGPDAVRTVRHRLTEASHDKQTSMGGPTDTAGRRVLAVNARRAHRAAGSTRTARQGTIRKT